MSPTGEEVEALACIVVYKNNARERALLWYVPANPEDYAEVIPLFSWDDVAAWNRRALATEARGGRETGQCKVTGHPAGTECWKEGHVCDCEPCQRYRAALNEAHRKIEQAPWYRAAYEGVSVGNALDGGAPSPAEVEPDGWQKGVARAAFAITMRDSNEAYHQLYLLADPKCEKLGNPFDGWLTPEELDEYAALLDAAARLASEPEPVGARLEACAREIAEVSYGSGHIGTKSLAALLVSVLERHGAFSDAQLIIHEPTPPGEQP